MWRILIFLSYSIHLVFCEKISIVNAPEVGFAVTGIWDACSESVFYVDFLATGKQASIFRYDYNEDKGYSAYIQGQSSPAFIQPLKECNKYKNLFAVGLGHNTAIIEWDGKSKVAIVKGNVFGVEENDPTSRFFGINSEEGRLYGGTFHTSFCGGPSNSSFYKYTKEKGLQLLFSGTQVTTGVAFDKDRGYIYHLDSCSSIITEYQVDANGDICNGRVIFDFRRLGYKAAYPISIEADKYGFIYTTLYNDGSVWKIDPRTSSGNKIAQMPFNLTSSVTFGGPKGDILFVLVGKSRLDVRNGQVTGQNSPGTSLYKLFGLGPIGREYSRLKILKTGYDKSSCSGPC